MGALYRVLLGLLPSEFDATDRAEMMAHYETRVERARERSGRGGAALVQLSEALDLALSVLRTRRGRGFFDGFRQDVRLGLRSLVREPLVSALAVVSLALGIGATTAVFSALDVWLVRPLPVAEPDRLVSVSMANREKGWDGNPFSPRDFLDWRGAARSVELAGYRAGGANLDLGDRTERVDVTVASANLLDVLGYGPRLGRGFAPEEERRDAPRVAVLSHGFWRRAMGADPSVPGRTVELDGRSYTVVGVLEPRTAFGPLDGDVWIPFRFSPESPRNGHSIHVLGRLAEGITLRAAREELDGVAGRVARADPERTFPNATVRSFRDAVYGDLFERGGAVLGVCVLFVLLIACANISNLLLARGMRRTHELAVRSALGAGRGRIVRQLLTESGVLACVGGATGVAVAWLGVHGLLGWVLPRDVPGWEQIALDGRALAAAVVLTLVSVLLFGIAPALRGSRVDLRDELAEGRGGFGRRRRRLSVGLVAGEVALALVLLVSAGLLMKSLAELHTTDLGFRTEDAISFRLYVPSVARSGAEEVRSFHDQVTRSVGDLPRVTGIAAASGPPIGRWSTFLYSATGDAPDSGRSRRSAENRVVTPSYLDVMGMRLLAGRWLSAETDRPGASSVAVVSRVLAEAHWGSAASALGRRIEIDGTGEVLEIVGVVEAGRLRGPQRAPPPVVFRALAQHPTRALFYVVETDREFGPVLSDVRGAVRSVDRAAALDRAGTLQDVMEAELEPERATLQILATLAGIALLLTLVGVYGVMAHSVGQRRREMGLRLALGADHGRLVRMVLAQNGRPALLALLGGAALSVPVGRVLAGVLEGVESNDPAILLGVGGLLFGAVVAAALIPARRASRVDPVESFRVE